MKKIILASNTSWSILNFRLNLMKALQNQGWEVIAVAPYDEYAEKIKVAGFKFYPIELSGKGTNPVKDFRTMINFYKIYKALKPDVICHFTIKPNIYGTIAASLLKIKTINNITGLGTLFVKKSVITSIAKLLYKISLNKASKVFFQNSEDYDLFISMGLAAEDKSDILPGSGVDLTLFKPNTNTLKSGEFTFAFISRLLWEKGLKEYVEAAAVLKEKYKNIEFILLGTTEEGSAEYAQISDIRAWEQAGYIKYYGVSDRVQDFIASSDCVVLPSYYREGVPRILLEAASMAKPIITTDSVGCRNAVDNGSSGFLCNPKNSVDLVYYMEKLFLMPIEQRMEMGLKGREKMISQFSEDIIINKYTEAVNSLTDKV